MPHFDLVIIGSGSGNSLVDAGLRRLAGRDRRGRHFGGTCLNVGCIPTKMFVYPPTSRQTCARGAARRRRHARRGALAGHPRPHLRPDRPDLGAAAQDYRAGRREHRPCTTATPGSPTGARALRRLEPATRSPPTGSCSPPAARPVIPPDIAASRRPYHTSRHGHAASTSCRRGMVILGGGYIAAEFAHVFSALGVAGHPGRPRRPAAAPAATPRSADRFTETRPRNGGTSGVGSAGRGATGDDSARPRWTSPTAARGRRPTCCWSRPAGCRTPTGSTSPRRASRRTRTAGSWSTSTSRTHGRRASGRSATSRRRTSSSTSPTTRRGSSRTTCCTPDDLRRRPTTGSCPPRCSPTRRSPPSG